MARSQRMTRSIVSNWFGLVVLAGGSTLVTPVMVHHLGVVDYGVWVLASSILDYYGLLDLGMRSAMFRYVSLFRGGSVREEVDRTFTSALLLVTGTAIFICGLSVGVAYLVPRYVSVHGTSPRLLSWLLLLLGVSVAIMFPTRMLATYISAHQRWDLYNVAGSVAIITRAVVIIVLLKLGYGILAIAIATVVIAIVSMGLHVVFVLIADPHVRVRVRLITVGRIRELFAFSMRSLLVSVGDYLRFYSDSAVIAAVLNVSLVTPFNVATRLIECFKSVVIAAGGPVFGAMTELDGGNRQKDLQELLLRSTRLLALLSILGGVLLLVDGRALLRLWVGKEVASAYSVVAVLAFGYMINLAQHPTLLIVIAKGRHGPLGWWTIAEGIANIVLSVIWGISHGLLGVAMGTIVPMLLVKIFVQPWYALKAAEVGAWEYLSKGLARPLVVGLLFAVVAGKISISGETTAPLFASTVTSQVMIFLAVAWFLGLTRAERQWLWEYGRQHLCWPVLRQARELEPQRSEVDLRSQ
jgi:O-antigen/teichoic acid export membrane protein